MEKEKSRLIIFEKREMIVFFVMLLFLALSSFSLGVKLGKSISYNASGYIPEDRQSVDLKSVQEETVDKMVGDSSESSQDNSQDNSPENSEGKGSSGGENGALGENPKENEVYSKLKEEFDQFETPAPASNAPEGSLTPPAQTQNRPQGQTQAVEKAPATSTNSVAPAPIPAPILETSPATPAANPDTTLSPSSLSASFTIQLGSYPKKEEAMNYAQGLKIRGYSPIVQEVILKDRGPWYRVSVGQFESVAMAKDYIAQEESLFQGKDYIITELK